MTNEHDDTSKGNTPKLVGHATADQQTAWLTRAEPNEVTELVERLIAKVADTDRQLAQGIEKSTVYSNEAKAAQLVVWKDQAACSLPLRVVRQAASTLTSQAEEIADLQGRLALNRAALRQALEAKAALTTRIGELEAFVLRVSETRTKAERPDHIKVNFDKMILDARAALTKEKGE